MSDYTPALAVQDLVRASGEATTGLARRVGVGVTDVTALDHILAQPGAGPTEIGHRLGIRSASATTLVDRLEAAGHVRRAPHPSDRRRQTVEVTEHATAEVLTHLRPLLDRIDEAAAALTPAEAEATVRFLTRVAEAMRAYAREA